jgi:hypothetical protein
MSTITDCLACQRIPPGCVPFLAQATFVMARYIRASLLVTLLLGRWSDVVPAVVLIP